MKRYSEAVNSVKTIRETMIKSNIYTDEQIKSSMISMNMLLQEIYGVGVFEVEKDTGKEV